MAWGMADYKLWLSYSQHPRLNLRRNHLLRSRGDFEIALRKSQPSTATINISIIIRWLENVKLKLAPLPSATRIMLYARGA